MSKTYYADARSVKTRVYGHLFLLAIVVAFGLALWALFFALNSAPWYMGAAAALIVAVVLLIQYNKSDKKDIVEVYRNE